MNNNLLNGKEGVTLLVFLFIALQFLTSNGFQYVLNITLATFVSIYLFLTIDRMSKKEWINHAITKTERMKVLYLSEVLILSFILLNIAWLLSSFIEEDTKLLHISSLLDKVYTLSEGMWILLGWYLTFQVNMELSYLKNGDIDGEGIITRVLKARHIKQAKMRE